MDSWCYRPIMTVPQLVTREEAAELLRVSVKTIDRRIAAGAYRVQRVGRSVRIFRDSLYQPETSAAADVEDDLAA